jgi:hypothetical protein
VCLTELDMHRGDVIYLPRGPVFGHNRHMLSCPLVYDRTLQCDPHHLEANLLYVWSFIHFWTFIHVPIRTDMHYSVTSAVVSGSLSFSLACATLLHVFRLQLLVLSIECAHNDHDYVFNNHNHIDNNHIDISVRVGERGNWGIVYSNMWWQCVQRDVDECVINQGSVPVRCGNDALFSYLQCLQRIYLP